MNLIEQTQLTQLTNKTEQSSFGVPTEMPPSGEPSPQSDFEIKGDVLLQYHGNETEVTVPEGVKKIGTNAFAGNGSLVSVILPEDVKIIGERAFSGCRGLKEINLSHVQKIASAAFYKCRELKKIDLTEIEALESQAFWGAGVREVTGLEKLAKLGDNIFDKTPLFDCYDTICGSDMLIIQHVLFAGYRCKGEVVIPEGVEIIASGAFQGARELTSVLCSDTVREIRDGAFEDCFSLEKFWMSDSVVSVGEDILAGDCWLRDLRLSEQLEAMPLLHFLEADSLTSLTIPERCVVPPMLFDYDYDYGPYNREPKSITIAPGKKVYSFLKDPCRKRDLIYSTEPFREDWMVASEQYGWSLHLLQLNSEELTLAPGGQGQLAFNSGAKAEWKSEDEAVVQVDRDGGLTAVGVGATRVTATIYGKEYCCRVVVGQ